MSPREAILEALRELPRAPDMAPERWETLSRREADYLVRFGPKAWSRYSEESRPEVVRQLSRLARALEEATTAASNLGVGAAHRLFVVGLLHPDFDEPADLTRHLRETAEAVRRATDVPNEEPPLGQAGKERARSVAICLCRAYRDLTGKEVTVPTFNSKTHAYSGSLFNLVTAVFRALDIKDSPVNMIRESKGIVNQRGRPKQKPAAKSG